MKTKEEILEKHGWIDGFSAHSRHDLIHQSLLEAMEEYAKQMLPEQSEIDDQVEKYAFRVPYDGSNNFYDQVALKHYKAGIEWVINRFTLS